MAGYAARVAVECSGSCRDTIQRIGGATHLRQGYGAPSIEGKAARVSSERAWEANEFQSRKGISEIEGKAARVAAKERG